MGGKMGWGDGLIEIRVKLFTRSNRLKTDVDTFQDVEI